MAKGIRVLRLVACLALVLGIVIAMPACESTEYHGGEDHAGMASTCALEGCNQPADASVSAMVDGKKVSYCCAGCKSKAAH